MKKIVSVLLIPAFAALLSACGGSEGGTGGAVLAAPGIAVGEPSPGGQVVAADFIKMARDGVCAERRNRLFVIDQKQVLWDRAGNCADASYARTLFGSQPSQQLCTAGDSIAGLQLNCADTANRALFDTMLKNLDKADLGLGSTHKVEQLTVLPSDGSTLAFDILWQSVYSAVDDARNVQVTDAAAFEKLWNDAHANLSSIHPVPVIDFSKKMVVGVFTGQQKVSCRSVTVARTGVEDGKLVVEYDTGRVQETALCTASFTSPGTLAVLDRYDTKVQFNRITPAPLAYSRVPVNLDSSNVNTPAVNVVVKDGATWERVWTRYAVAGTPLPVVDFSKSMVLFAFYGVTTGCDGNKLEEVSRVNGKLYVTSSYTPPGPADACIAAFTAKGVMAQVDRSDEPVVFISKRMPAPTI